MTEQIDFGFGVFRRVCDNEFRYVEWTDLGAAATKSCDASAEQEKAGESKNSQGCGSRRKAAISEGELGCRGVGKAPPKRG
jgi:hypothetical protein